jgi:hypothetical protein
MRLLLCILDEFGYYTQGESGQHFDSISAIICKAYPARTCYVGKTKVDDTKTVQPLPDFFGFCLFSFDRDAGLMWLTFWP